jgi:hypothetical protein
MGESAVLSISIIDSFFEEDFVWTESCRCRCTREQEEEMVLLKLEPMRYTGAQSSSLGPRLVF